MCKIQVLVTTMHQVGIQKYYEMNLKSDAIIANQTNNNSFSEYRVGDKTVRLVSTETRGLSKNRNIAIDNIFETDEYILFSDDDLVFHDNYEEIITEEFKNNDNADAIKFNLNCVSERKISMKPIEALHYATRRELASMGVCGLVIKKNVLINEKLSFNERFGSGTKNYCGEDSLFLQELKKKRLKVVLSPKYIADIDQSDSTWFEGHNEKFFTVGGMIINESYPLLSPILVIRSAYKAAKRKTSELSFYKILKCYYIGLLKNVIEKRKTNI